MDEIAKNLLDDALAQDQKMKEAAKAKSVKLQDEQNDFVSRFKEHRQKVLEPAMKEFADYIKPHGWTARVLITNSGSEYSIARDVVKSTDAISLEFARGEWKAPSRSPLFTLTCSPTNKNVSLYSSTIGPNHGGSQGGRGSFSLEELDQSFVQQKLANFFKTLLSDARPFNER